MVRIPHYVEWLGWLRGDKVFQEIDGKLNEDARIKIYPILTLRFLCHAYISYPIIFLIYCDLYICGPCSGDECLKALFIFAWSSVSNALASPFGGAYADKKGCQSAIRLGVTLMIGIMALYCLITLFRGLLGDMASYLTFAAIVLQFLTGIAISIIDGADTELLKKTAREQKLSDDDGDRLEGVCNKLKYTGAAFASLIGCSLYFTVTYFAQERKAIAGALIFLLTGATQLLLTLRYLDRIIEEPVASREEGQDTPWRLVPAAKEILTRIASAVREIVTHKVLLVWVVIVAVTEGGLLSSIYYFQFRALTSLRYGARTVLLLLLLVSVLYWLASVLASWGSSYFNRWHKRAAKAAKNSETNMTTLAGRAFRILNFRLSAAIFILVVTLVSVALVTFGRVFEGKAPITFRLGFLFLFFFAACQFFRGFASPLHKATVDNLAAARSLENPTTILSCALAAGRPFYFFLTLAITSLL